MLSSPTSVRPSSRSSPPPNCAICLDPCNNKCVTDSCQHQFCFNCLFQWSKVKAECPLCKKPIKTIMHSIKSSSEYKEITIGRPEEEIRPSEDIIFIGEDLMQDISNLYLPNGPPPPQRRFRFRTTLTVDPHGEYAIQQLLLSHPLTETVLMPLTRRRNLPLGPMHSNEHFRRYVYQRGIWVHAPPDVSGRYRECTPEFFRENPAQRHRIVPWLNRELNVLLNSNATLVGYVLTVILDQLPEHHVLSPEFRLAISPHLGDKTDHFIHEFFNFVRSPFDMFGYDRHISYDYSRPPVGIASSSTFPIENNTSTSVTAAPTNNDDDGELSSNDCVIIEPNPSDVIVINTTDEDSDVIIREPTPPVVVSVSDTSEAEGAHPNNTTEEPSNSNLPIKIRFKLKNFVQKRRKKPIWAVMGKDSNDETDEEYEPSRRRRVRSQKTRRPNPLARGNSSKKPTRSKRQRSRSNSSCSSNSSSSSSHSTTTSNSTTCSSGAEASRRRQKRPRQPYNYSFSSSDNEPLSKYVIRSYTPPVDSLIPSTSATAASIAPTAVAEYYTNATPELCQPPAEPIPSTSSGCSSMSRLRSVVVVKGEVATAADSDEFTQDYVYDHY